MKQADFEVIIIGGSYSGLSAAMSLGRSLRNVLIIDNGEPCNQQTPHSHNFLTQDGSTPKDIYIKAKEQLQKYDTIQFLNDLAITGKRLGDLFEITTKNGKKISCQKLIFATGIKDLLPAIDGLAECWGISVIHCPYCHGYEFKNAKTAMITNGERAMHLTSLIKNLTDQLTILTNGPSDFNKDQLKKLKRNNISVIENKIEKVEHQNGYVENVYFGTHEPIAFQAIYAAVPFVQHTDILQSLGCQITEQGYISIDSFQRTTVNGVFACGDNSSPMRSVANAVAAGSLTGAMVNKELADASFL
ncbi:NAD(P)/FAD-dependent oxidoreductase [Niabella ginsengisoli]|uniref:NAD(P)/FAD-dependent oxidoreductase n=1 Tax=Niabella ginsengisoli TaxID=522298 RepID=A0ABS9SKU2_9BACT|nr:NAD(P)/FAD-dependent oxidoreductase [Niabella ginsengisoli]MCH5598996.1 NAD(P)/FAD-dependent oxidoreductase [Niabella ginsengisoli]